MYGQSLESGRILGVFIGLCYYALVLYYQIGLDYMGLYWAFHLCSIIRLGWMIWAVIGLSYLCSTIRLNWSIPFFRFLPNAIDNEILQS